MKLNRILFLLMKKELILLHKINTMKIQGWRFDNTLFVSEPQVSTLADLSYIHSK